VLTSGKSEIESLWKALCEAKKSETPVNAALIAKAERLRLRLAETLLKSTMSKKEYAGGGDGVYIMNDDEVDDLTVALYHALYDESLQVSDELYDEAKKLVTQLSAHRIYNDITSGVNEFKTLLAIFNKSLNPSSPDEVKELSLANKEDKVDGGEGFEIGDDDATNWESNPESLVNKRVEILWAKGQRYGGYVSEYDASNGKHHVKYDDGDEKWYIMTSKTFWIMDESGEKNEIKFEPKDAKTRMFQGLFGLSPAAAAAAATAGGGVGGGGAAAGASPMSPISSMNSESTKVKKELMELQSKFMTLTSRFCDVCC
jgi:hypothetical protein